MKIKTTFDNRIEEKDILQYQKYIEHKFNQKNINFTLQSLQKKLQQDNILSLVFDDNKQIIGSLLFKVEEDFFNVKKCNIIDIELSNNNNKEEALEMLYKNLVTICNESLCQEILYSCLTNNKFLQKFFTSKKFILEKFAFRIEINQ